MREGLFGFNGAIVAVALLYFLQPNMLAWSYVVLASACTTVVMAALLNVLDTWKIPALTAPFVFTTLCFVLACARFGRLHSTHLLPTAGLPRAATVEGIVTMSTVVYGLFSGVAQVFFQANVITGILFTIGLLISSRVACVAALLGSLAGLLAGWGLGDAEPAIRAGAFGFNSVLTAIALGSVFFVRNAASTAYESDVNSRLGNGSSKILLRHDFSSSWLSCVQETRPTIDDQPNSTIGRRTSGISFPCGRPIP